MVITARLRNVKPLLLPLRLVRSLNPPRFLLHSKPLTCLPVKSTRHAWVCMFSTAAHKVLDKMPQRDNFIINALTLFKHASIDDASFVASFHCLLLKTNTLADLPVPTSLLTAYARAGDLDSSLSLFDEHTARDIISWNAIMKACVLHCCFHMSVLLFRQMMEEVREFDSTTMVILLSAMSRTNSLKQGMILHGAIIKRSLHLGSYLSNALVDMYAKGGDLGSSELVFEGMQFKDTTSWNSIIRGRFFNGLCERSVFGFKEMCRSAVPADEVGLSCVISACSSLEELFSVGESVHGLTTKLGYEGAPYSSVSNSLISFYSRHGEVEAAEQVFECLVYKNLISWNGMLSGFVENGRAYQAVNLFREMQSRSTTRADVVTLVTIIPACGEFNLLLQGKSIHGYALRWELHPLVCSIGNSLLYMYLKCSDLSAANHLFRTMPYKDLISWNTVISGYSRNVSLREQAKFMFRELLQTGVRCSLASLLAIVPSCSTSEDLGFGKTVHCLMLKLGFASVISAANALMHMYITCGDMTAAFLLMKSMISTSDVISWNTILVSCVQNAYYQDALEAFAFMRSSLLLIPDHITWVSTLLACGNLKLLGLGKSMHGLLLKCLILFDVRVKNALLTMYFRCGDTKSAQTVFHTDECRNLCSWNCMISGFVQNRDGGRALELFRQIESFAPNEISMVGILCACSQLADLKRGREINGYVVRLGLERNVFISAALVDVYSKCGRLDIALRVFESSAKKSIASWNSMISAYGLHGHGRKAIELFGEMTGLGIEPTKSTFIALLSACSHSGLVDEGWKHYNLLVERFGMKPACEHDVCMVDMLGRAGRLGEACEFVKSLRADPNHGVLGALLSACNDHTDLKMGKSMANHLFCMEPENTGYYVTFSNLYARHGMWADVVELRSMIHDKGLTKPPACSVIDALI